MYRGGGETDAASFQNGDSVAFCSEVHTAKERFLWSRVIIVSNLQVIKGQIDYGEVMPVASASQKNYPPFNSFRSKTLHSLADIVSLQSSQSCGVRVLDRVDGRRQAGQNEDVD